MVGEDGSGTDGDTDDDPTQPTDPSAEGGEGGDDEAISLNVNRDVDVLFVVDNSGSMGEEQARLSRNISVFVDVLEQADANYRIGVTTTDNGNPLCNTTAPEAGKLQLSSCLERPGEFVFNGVPPADATTACTDHCGFDTITTVPTTTERDPEAKPRPWLERIDGTSNLAESGGTVPTIAEAFQCVGPQGIAGCGFESHLESMYKALLRSELEEEAQFDFLRASAVLSIVFVTDELDCSYDSDFQSIFLSAAEGGNQVFWSDPEASAPSSAVCFNAGVMCTGGPGYYDECHSSNKNVDGDADVADQDAVLYPVYRYIDFVQQLEDQRQQITPGQEVLVAMIAGVPVGYDSGQADITYADGQGQDQLDFGIGPGCVNNSVDPPATARPPVREREFTENFQVSETRNLYSVCSDDFSPALNDVANAIRNQIRPTCMPQCVADTDLVTIGVQPSCVLTQHSLAGGSADDIDVPPCEGTSPPAGQHACYVALVDRFGENVTPSGVDEMSEACTDMGWNLEFQIVRAVGVPAPSGSSITASCQLSQSKPQDCPGLP